MLGIGLSIADSRRSSLAGESAIWDQIYSTGLIAGWKFDEGSGSTANDFVGTRHIDLDAPTTPGYAWTARGIQLTNGLVQTPSVTASRTVAILYQTTRGEAAGFLVDGGPSGSGSGVLGESVTATYTHHVGGVRGVTPLKYRTSNGTAAYRLNRGAWKVAFVDWNAASSTIIGLGGRHSTTISRCASFQIAGALVYSGVLDDAARLAIYNAYRAIAASRGFYIDYRDCPTQEDVYWLWGESNADGRALISGLSAPEQAKTLTRNKFVRNNGGTLAFGPAPTALTLGDNPNNAGATLFGPIIPIAWEREDDATITRTMHCVMSGLGSTYIAPGGVGSSTSAFSWADTELPASGLLWFSMRALWDLEDNLLMSGIGPNLIGHVSFIGLNDAANTAHTTDAATVQARMQAIMNAVETYTAAPDLPFVLLRPHTNDPASNATAIGHVRGGMDAFAAANTHVTLIDTDATSLNVDNVHYSAAGMKALAPAIYAALSGG